MPVVFRSAKPAVLIAVLWKGSARATHHCVTCGRVRSVSVSPVGALSTTIRSYSPSRWNCSSQSSTEPSFIPGSAAISSAAIRSMPCQRKTVSSSSRMLPQYFFIE